MRTRWSLFLIFVVAAGLAAVFVGCKSGNGATTPKTLANEPDVTFKDLSGKDVPLAGLKGKVVVVNFWATWCEP
ncbi:MAG: redoxin domain-containing protein, partial [Candidatus Acidiferrales bacterium]